MPGRPIDTGRWRRVIELLAQGYTNQEIADELHVAIQTAKWYMRGLMRQAGLDGGADERRLVVWAVRQTEKYAHPEYPPGAPL